MKADNLDEAMYSNFKAEFNDYKKCYVVARKANQRDQNC